MCTAAQVGRDLALDALRLKAARVDAFWPVGLRQRLKCLSD